MNSLPTEQFTAKTNNKNMKKTITVKPNKSEATSLAIKQAVTPPPTKTEVIEALLQIKKAEFFKKKELAQQEVKEAASRLRSAVKKKIKRPVISDSDIHFSRYSSSTEIRVGFDVPEQGLEKEIKIWRDAYDASRQYWDEVEQRKNIRNAINGKQSGRVEAMLNTPEIRQKLQTLAIELGV